MDTIAPAQRSARRPKATVLFLGIAVLCFALIGTALFLARPAPEARQTQDVRAVFLALTPHNSVSFTPDGQSLVSLHRGAAVVWNISREKTTQQFSLSDEIDAHLSDLEISPDGRLAAVAGSETSLWDLASARQIALISQGGNEQASNYTYQVTFSPDGKQLAALSGIIKIYDAASGTYEQSIPTSEQNPDDVLSMAFSPDGRYLAAGHPEGQALLWDFQAQQFVRTFQGGEKAVSDLAFSPDGRYLAAASSNIVTLWDVATGQQVRTITITSGWDRLLGRVPHANAYDWTTSLAFSPDGKRLAAGSTDATAGVWDVQTGAQLFRLTGHTNSIIDIAFSPSGSSLVTRSRDATMRIWSVAAP